MSGALAGITTVERTPDRDAYAAQAAPALPVVGSAT
jgi:hypothetical protein